MPRNQDLTNIIEAGVDAVIPVRLGVGHQSAINDTIKAVDDTYLIHHLNASWITDGCDMYTGRIREADVIVVFGIERATKDAINAVIEMVANRELPYSPRHKPADVELPMLKSIIIMVDEDHENAEELIKLLTRINTVTRVDLDT